MSLTPDFKSASMLFVLSTIDTLCQDTTHEMSVSHFYREGQTQTDSTLLLSTVQREGTFVKIN